MPDFWACLVINLKLTFSYFKQYYTHSNTLFHPHIFQKTTNNNSQTILPNIPKDLTSHFFWIQDHRVCQYPLQVQASMGNNYNWAIWALNFSRPTPTSSSGGHDKNTKFSPPPIKTRADQLMIIVINFKYKIILIWNNNNYNYNWYLEYEIIPYV